MKSQSVNKFIMAYVSFPSQDIAKRIAQILVKDKIAFCAKIVNKVSSFYMWEDQLQEEDEIYLLIKSQEGKVDEIKNVLDREHPYKVYEFLYHPVESGNSKYSDWANSMMGTGTETVKSSLPSNSIDL